MQNLYEGAPTDSGKRHLLGWLSDQQPVPLLTARSTGGLPQPLMRLVRSLVRPDLSKNGCRNARRFIQRFAGALLTGTLPKTKTALAMGTVGLLTLTAVACGGEATPASTAPSERAERTEQTVPGASEARTATRSQPETTAATAASPAPNTVATRTLSDSAASASADTAPASNEAATPVSTEAAMTPERAREANYHHELAKHYLQQRRYHRAAHNANQAIASNPDLSEAYMLRGLARTALHDYGGALEDLDRAIDLEAGSDVKALVLRSYVHSELGDYDLAVADAENAQQAAGRLGDDSARAEAGTALFIAHYRQGDYEHPAVRGYGLDAYRSAAGNQGLGSLIDRTENLGRQLDELVEIDASLLLKPDDAELHHRRGTVHRGMRWYAKAVEDFTVALELYGDEAPERLYLDLAETHLEMEEHEKVVQILDRVDQPTNVTASALLAYAYLRQGQPEDAMRSINAFDYGFDTPVRGRSGREAWVEYIHGRELQLPWIFVPHFVLKGAVFASVGDHEEAVKYLNLLGCGGVPWRGTGSDDIPADASRHRKEVLDNFWREGDFYQELTVAAQQELSELCGYPSEFVDDPEAGGWATVILRNLN